MKKCVFLTMDSLDGFSNYDQLLIIPLNEVGWLVEEISWRKEGVDWSSYDLVLIRSTWDYQNTPSLFLTKLSEINSKTHLQNSFEIVKWNLDKCYLKDLHSKGHAIVPTLWPDYLDGQNPSFFEGLNSKEIVIKPTISANADNTYRLNPDSFEQQKTGLLAIFKNKPFMVQRFIKSIVTEGEYSLFYFAGEFSHSILKKPAPNDFRVQEEHGGQLSLIDADRYLISMGSDIIDSMDNTPLYARVDLVRLEDNSFALMELELIEPSLYFNMEPKSIKRFISKIVKY